MSPVDMILENYQSETKGSQENLVRLLQHGKLGGTGRLIIYPVDQGFEHGADRSFIMNPQAYDPLYHFELAAESGVSGFAAPLGLLEVGARQYGTTLPLILKMNSANLLCTPKDGPDQAITATIDDALRLNCTGIGLTLYPGSPVLFSMIEKAKELISQAKQAGLVVIIWSYPRGGNISKKGETSMDIVSYGAHMACLLGAHIVKCKLPTGDIEDEEVKTLYQNHRILYRHDNRDTPVANVVRSCFAGRRLVIFSGGASKSVEDVLNDTRDIHQNGGHGSIIGRNCFQRPRFEALEMIRQMIEIYKEAPHS